MATIKEDYVSFETARLLKEKGFNEDCYTYYDDIDDCINRFDKGYHFNNTSYPWGVPYDINKAKKYVVAPTLQMAMKWLREVHHIFLSIQQHMDMSYVWYAYMDGFAKGCDRESHNNTYEGACEVAIKYCLENLI